MIVQVSYQAKWEFKDFPHYKISTCKKIIKCTKSGGSIGYFINGIFFKKSDINNHIQVIKVSKLPF